MKNNNSYAQVTKPLKLWLKDDDLPSKSEINEKKYKPASLPPSSFYTLPMFLISFFLVSFKSFLPCISPVTLSGGKGDTIVKGASRGLWET